LKRGALIGKAPQDLLAVALYSLISSFRILERGILDGYTVGRIERIDDMEDIPVDLITSDPQPSSVDSSSTEKDSSTRKSEEPHLLASVLANNERVRSKEELVKICLDFLSRLRGVYSSICV
jgi:hypothetical protein